MFPSILGTVLSFFLLVATSARIFFLKNENKDALSLLSLASFVASSLNIFVWSANFASAIAFVLSFFLLAINIPAMTRFFKHSYTDRAHPFFVTMSALLLLLSLATISLYIYFLPVPMNAKKFLANEEKPIRMTGSFEQGFKTANYFQKTSAIFYEYEPRIKKPAIPILFIPDKRADAQNYRPYFLLLAERGYNVITADFFSRDEKWFHSIFDFFPIRKLAFVVSFFLNKEKFESQKDFFAFNVTNEIVALKKYAKEKFGADKKFLIVSDGMSNNAATAFAKKSGDYVFALDDISFYKTANFGFLEQTEPAFAFYFGLYRDKNLSTPKKLANETIKKIEELK